MVLKSITIITQTSQVKNINSQLKTPPKLEQILGLNLKFYGRKTGKIYNNNSTNWWFHNITIWINQ